MNSLYLLIPLGLIQVAGAIWIFLWAINRGQYEDLEGPGTEFLRDEWESDLSTPAAQLPNQILSQTTKTIQNQNVENVEGDNR